MDMTTGYVLAWEVRIHVSSRSVYEGLNRLSLLPIPCVNPLVLASNLVFSCNFWALKLGLNLPSA